MYIKIKMNSKINFQKLNLLNSQNSISPFIDEGVFLDYKPLIKRNYMIENFKYLKDYNNEKIIIGKGGYGQLYLAQNIKDGKEYAIKNVSKDKMKSVGIDISIIKREIDIHIRITHPHIIKLFSFSEDRHNYYLAMEYAQKGTLYKLIRQKRGMSENEAFHYFIQVASAIHFLHSNGYAHRDIKPENILLDKNGSVKLCDFGWCVNVSKGNRITFCGTYEYMAPEMINDEFYDLGIDIWSLGVLLYEMIHGYSPFRALHFLKDAKSAMKEIFRNIKSNNYSIDKNISKECIDLIDQLLTSDTKKRIKINELFMHPWVKAKEKDYFPQYNRFITLQDNPKIKNNNSNCSIITFKNNYNKKKELMMNKEKEKNNESKKKHVKNKSFCFVINKGNNKNNGLYFIKEKNANKQNKEIKENREKRKLCFSNIEKENDNKDLDFRINENNLLLKKINKIKEKNDFNSQRTEKKERNGFNSQRIKKKEQNSKNNFIFTISSNSKILDLSKINKKENKKAEIRNKNEFVLWNTENKDLNRFKRIKVNKEREELNNTIEPINTKKKLLLRINQKEATNISTNNDNEKKNNLYERWNNKINKVLNKNSNIKTLEEKKKRGESFSKNILNEKLVNNLYDYNPLSQSPKYNFTFIYNKPRKDLGSLTLKKITPLKRKKIIINKDNKYNNEFFLTNREKMRERRAKSMQQTLNEISTVFQENKIKKNLFGKKKYNYLKKNIIIDNPISNYVDNDNNYNNNKDISNKGEEFQLDELFHSKENFQRFRKKVVHFKKKIYMNTEGNIIKSLNDSKKKRIENYSNKTNRSIQNVFYNTFYNCLFENLPDNNNPHINNINETYSNKFYINQKILQKNNTDNLLYHKVFSNDKKNRNINKSKKFDGYSNYINEKKETIF